MTRVELWLDGDLIYIDDKLITFHQGCCGDYYTLDGCSFQFDTLEDVARHYHESFK